MVAEALAALVLASSPRNPRDLHGEAGAGLALLLGQRRDGPDCLLQVRPRAEAVHLWSSCHEVARRGLRPLPWSQETSLPEHVALGDRHNPGGRGWVSTK